MPPATTSLASRQHADPAAAASVDGFFDKPGGTPDAPERQQNALRGIAIFETVKGFAALAASFGLLGLVHHDLRHLAVALIGHFHLPLEARYPALFLHYADVLQDANLRNLVLLAWGYAAIRLAEGYGLWRDRAWAEWLAALSGGLYLPFEAIHLAHRPNLINALVLTGNLVVVAYMVWRLRRRGLAQGVAAQAS
jgi:uncharacterized membrane protein (DUF2068 family)